MNNEFLVIDQMIRNRLLELMRPTIDVECEVLESKPLNLNIMQPSQIHWAKKLAELKGQKQTAAIKAEIKEIQAKLGLKPTNEKASIADDEQIDEPSIQD